MCVVRHWKDAHRLLKLKKKKKIAMVTTPPPPLLIVSGTHRHTSIKKGMFGFEPFGGDFRFSCKCHPDTDLWHFSAEPDFEKDHAIFARTYSLVRVC